MESQAASQKLAQAELQKAAIIAKIEAGSLEGPLYKSSCYTSVYILYIFLYLTWQASKAKVAALQQRMSNAGKKALVSQVPG